MRGVHDRVEVDALRALARGFVTRELLPHERTVEEAAAIPASLAAELRRRALEAGLYAYNMPAEIGGPGLPMVAQMAIREELGQVSMALADVCARPPRLLLACRGEQVDDVLLPAVRGELLVSFALTEPDAGSDAAALRTRAHRDGDGWVLDGTKQFISHGSDADVCVVFARVERADVRPPGLSAFLVRRDTPGFHAGRIERTMGWRGYPVAEIILDGCRVPASALLGEEGEGMKLAFTQIAEARLGVAAHCVGLARRALNLAVEQAMHRRTFGAAVADHQGIRWMLADMATGVEAAHGLVDAAARLIDDGGDARLQVSMAKLFATETAGRVVDSALQIFGGAGYMAGSTVEMLYRDVRAFRIGEGTSEIQRNQIAARLLAGAARGEP